MTVKRLISGFFRLITILLILLLLLGSGILVASSLTGQNGIFGYQMYLPADTSTEFRDTAVVVKVEEKYRLDDVVLFPTVDGVKTATITTEGDICNLAITDTGEYYAATSEEILGRALFYSYPVGVVCAWLLEYWITAAVGAFLLFCILLAILILLSVKGEKRKKEEAPVEKTPKIIEEQIVYRESEKAPLAEEDRAAQVSDFVVPKEEPAEEELPADAFPTKEEVQKLLEQDTKEIVWEKAEEKPEAEPAEGVSAEPEAEESEISEELTPVVQEEAAPAEEKPVEDDSLASIRNHFAKLEQELAEFKASLLNEPGEDK